MATLDLKTTKSKVEWCLINRKGTRGDDMILALTLWKNFHRSDFENLLKISLTALEIDLPRLLQEKSTGNMGKLPSFESCRRLRQKFNENGQYLPDDETVLKRRGKISEVRDYVQKE